MPRWTLIIVVVLVFLCLGANGQDYLLRHYTVEDGLPSNTVYTVHRDAKGFLWIMTDRGVARYNGIKFEKFTTFNGLSDNEVFGCREDMEGRLWFLTYNGELCYYKDDTFHNPSNTPFLKRRNKYPYIRFINVQEDSSIVFTFYSGRYFCYVRKDKCYEVDLDSNLIGPGFNHCIEKVGPDRFMLMRGPSTFIVDVQPEFKVVSERRNEGGKSFTNMYGCQNQEYIFDDTAIYDEGLKLLTYFPKGLQQKNLLHQLYANDKYWFFATNHGLYIQPHKQRDICMEVLTDKQVSSVSQDSRQNYWVTTLNDGLYSFSESFTESGIYPDQYSGKIKYAKEVKGHLFFCTENKDLYILEGGRRKFLFNPDRREFQGGTSTFFIDTNLCYYYLSHYLNMKVTNVLESSRQKLVCKSKVPLLNVFKRAIMSNGRLYVNTGTNILEANFDGLKSGDSLRYSSMIQQMGGRVFAMAKSHEGDVWCTTLDQVFKIEGGKAVVQPQFKGICFKFFNFYGKYIVGYTHYNQLLVCVNENGRIRSDTILKDCIWENQYRLDSSHVLISTNGLYYLLSLNLPNSPGYHISAIEHPFLPLLAETVCVGSKDCYFFKNGSIIKINKEELLKKAAPPVMYFTSLRTVKRSYRIDSVVELPFRAAGNIAISFSTLSFNGKDVSYQYSISKSGEDRWVNIKGDINLANQAFGVYVVKVRARTISSGYSKPIAFTLVILRPFWATWWFVGIIVVVALGLLLFIERKRVRLTLKKREKEHQNQVRFIKSEYKAMNALMNPHFIFNTLNNVQSLVNNDDKLNAIEYLAIFADLIRQNMHNISSESISLEKEIELVENYLLLEKLRFEDQLSYSVNISDGLYLSDIMVPPLLIQPLVENSIKHGILPLKSRGIKGTVHLNIYEREEVLYIEVRDNGIGVAKAKEKKSLHKSYGLDNLKGRIEQLSIIQGKEITFDLTDIKNDEGVQEWTVATITMAI